MEAFSSSNAANQVTESVVDNNGFDSVGGRKSEEVVADFVEVSSDEVSSDDLSLVEDEEDSDEEDSDEGEEDFDEEVEEFLNERKRILKDASNLKTLSGFFQHPEMPVEVDGFAAGRSYFSSSVVSDAVSEDEDEEMADALADAQALKKLAGAYLHPERSVEVAATACARNFFSQPWATEQETFGQAEMRARLVEESCELKERVTTYRHPEAPVDLEPATSMGRNYFSRPSAPEQSVEGQALVLAEMKALKRLSVDYLHPERPVEIDAAASGRNYFSRPSAPEQEEDEYSDDREIVLEEMKELKQAAVDFMHPERPVDMDTTGARSYFDRASAPEQDAEERELILQEMQALKRLSVDYLHPERPVEIDAAASGRNYFSRPSAPEQEEDEYSDDREIVLEEMKELKQAAVDFMHPERPVDMDTTGARSYFSRPSAPEQDEDAYEHALALKEAALLKQKAADYMHPELPVSTDSTAFGRNYFGRASAADQESFAEAEERASVIAESAGLKQGAELFSHPEKPLEVGSIVAGRNYFSRPSAEDSESEDDEERELVLRETAQLKKLALDYMHPEMPVSVAPASFGRNYYSRASADESLEEAEELNRVLGDAASLKKLAASYAHPESPVAATDASVFGRNYFSRASAPVQELLEEAEERAQVLADAMALKKLALDHFHPEVSVQTTDPAATGRNYFARASAVGASEHISSSGHANLEYKAEEQSHYDDYGHFEMDEEIFYDMRQSIVLPLPGDAYKGVSKTQSSKMSSEEEGELSRSPSSVMLFTGALEDADHPPLPTMG